jgi:Lon protease-like protein
MTGVRAPPEYRFQMRARGVPSTLIHRMDSPPTVPTPPLPDTLPVMVLSDCSLFPNCVLPLFIFEERYRRMLAHALATDRMFCIGNRLGRDAAKPEIFPYSTAGLVRMSKTQADGTSHVLLVGLQRIRLVGWASREPFLQARIEPMASHSGAPPGDLPDLRRRALELLPEPADEASGQHLRDMRRDLAEIACAEAVCDILSHHFVRRAACARKLLAESCVEGRYRILIEELQRQRAAA